MGGRRRSFLARLSTTAMAAAIISPRSADAVDNPLNLKGYFWETGRPYEKPDAPPLDDDFDFFSILEGAAEALRSPELTGAISEGRYGPASRLLRGGIVSESKIRLAANALIDSLPEDDDDAIYRANESFRVFLRYLDVLDVEVENASRPLIGAGGGGLGGDPRMGILTRLGEAEDALRAFVRNVRAGLKG